MDHLSLTQHRGTLSIRFGPMFSGKTTWLNGVLTEMADIGLAVLKITHTDDVRYDTAACDESGSTHNTSYTGLSNKIATFRCTRLSDVDVSKYHVIGVDEAQFYDDLLDVIEHWVEHLGKHVRVVGLDGDSSKSKFGQILDLIPLSDDAKKLNSFCKMCVLDMEKVGFKGNIFGISGPFTKRISSTTKQKHVSSKDYLPVCRYHHSYNL